MNIVKAIITSIMDNIYGYFFLVLAYIQIYFKNPQFQKQEQTIIGLSFLILAFISFAETKIIEEIRKIKK
jgi:hypothetical protein